MTRCHKSVPQTIMPIDQDSTIKKKNLRTQKQGHMENPGSAAGLLSPPN